MTTMFHWVFSSFRRSWVLPAIAALIIGALGSTWLALQHKANSMVEVTQSVPSEPLSYRVMQIAQEQVKAVKPAPTEAALYYAYVASAYADAFYYGNQQSAVLASQQMMDIFYPQRKTQVDGSVAYLLDQYNLDAAGASQEAIRKVVSMYSERYKTDGHDMKWDGVIPTGAGKWYKGRPADPFTPRAGEWKRWAVDKPIAVPAPPKVGSSQDLQEILKVKQVSTARNGQDVNIINFWGGVPGTEAPAGIWQNQLYRTIKDELPEDAHMADVKYSAMQKVLAQTLSDAFMECWKVKYTYWTARPNMRDPSITTAMDNPNFPGYVSGHSTISKAAADVLSTLMPKHTQQWQAMAVEARDSRLKAGIHFDIDNQVGFELGTEVAHQVIVNLSLTQQL